MIEFVFGALVGAVLAVVSPPVFRFVAAKIAQAKDQFNG